MLQKQSRPFHILLWSTDARSVYGNKPKSLNGRICDDLQSHATYVVDCGCNTENFLGKAKWYNIFGMRIWIYLQIINQFFFASIQNLETCLIQVIIIQIKTDFYLKNQKHSYGNIYHEQIFKRVLFKYRQCVNIINKQYWQQP